MITDSEINDKTKVPELFDAAKMVLNLQESTDMSLDEMDTYCNTKKQDIASLDEEYTQAKEKTEQAVSAMNNTLAENNTINENLNDYVNARDYLKENGAQIEELPSVANMIKNASKEKYNPKTIIAEISKNHDLKQRNADQEAQYKHNLERNQLKIKKNQELDDILEAKRPILEQAEKFEKIDVTPDHILTLYQKVAEVGEKTGISASDIIEKFTQDIAQYEQKIGFENVLNHQRQEIKSNNQNLEKIKEEEIKVTAKVKVKRKEEIKLEANYLCCFSSSTFEFQ